MGVALGADHMTRRRHLPGPQPWQRVGEVAAGLTKETGRAAIAHWLNRASEGDADAFQQADQIRQRLGLTWNDLLNVRTAA